MKKLIIILFTLHASLFTLHVTEAQVINVPAGQPTIQAGINAAVTGDTVLVAEGTYQENINFNGKAITVASHFLVDANANHINNTIIDGSQAEAPVVTLVTAEDTTSVLCGFTITGGSGFIIEEYNMKTGGGVFCFYAGVKLLNNKITGNEITHTGLAGGGGVGCFAEVVENWLVARDNMIYGNSCIASSEATFSGGIYVASNLVFRNNEVFNNECLASGSAQGNGCGLFFEEPAGSSYSFDICNNQLHDNNCEAYDINGAGILILGGAGTLADNFISNNSGIAVNAGTGGGLRLASTTGMVHVTGNIFSGNSIEGYRAMGGAVGVYLADDLVIIHDNTFEQNTLTASYAAWGGAISFMSNDSISIRNNLVQGNIIQGVDFVCGGGIWGQDGVSGVEFRNNKFVSNSGTAETGYGGGFGFYNDQNKRLVIDGNILDNNIMPTGGGLWTYNCFNTVVSNNIFTGNHAENIGGGYRMRHYAGKASESLFIEDRISMNDHMPDAYISGGVEHPLLINNTFMGNTALTGGAIYCDHEAEFPLIVNSVFWENEASVYGANIFYNGSDSLLIAYFDTSFINGLWEGGYNIYVDPGFIDDSCHISDTSQCSGAGIESIEIEGITYFAPGYDFEGDVRPGPYCYLVDIGADEIEFDCVGVDELNTQHSTLNIQTYPNPARGVVHCTLYIVHFSFVRVSLYNLQGQEVRALLDKELSAGEHYLYFDVSDLPDGIYFLRLIAGEKTTTQKLIITH